MTAQEPTGPYSTAETTLPPAARMGFGSFSHRSGAAGSCPADSGKEGVCVGLDDARAFVMFDAR